MKISEMINALKESKESYGDIEIEILIQSEDGSIHDMNADGSEYTLLMGSMIMVINSGSRIFHIDIHRVRQCLK